MAQIKNNERMIQIEKILGLNEEQIKMAIAMIHDLHFAEKNKDLEEYKVMNDPEMKKLCLEYLENYYLVKDLI